MNQILKRPVITEKSLMNASRGWYTFAVDIKSRKEAIARAISQGYNVDVLDVRTRTVHGKQHRVGRKLLSVRRPDWKKAMVKLKSGQHIDAFEVKAPPEAQKPTKK